MTRAERSDAARNRAAVLAAADELFATVPEPARLSMDDVAAAAGVGKGTLFRAFGNRAGLLQALWQRRYEPLRDAIESGPPPLGPETDPRQRIAAILDAILVVKLDNCHLTLAVEERSGGTSLYEQPQLPIGAPAAVRPPVRHRGRLRQRAARAPVTRGRSSRPSQPPRQPPGDLPTPLARRPRQRGRSRPGGR